MNIRPRPLALLTLALLALLAACEQQPTPDESTTDASSTDASTDDEASTDDASETSTDDEANAVKFDLAPWPDSVRECCCEIINGALVCALEFDSCEPPRQITPC